ncbi:antibiotic acetyltransferase [Lacrimispora amygdalina]|uniref:Antibiotic acetyltransferase n=1 Tax=Lacrimispora amygdalina TaxID=253257 RepID=A0A3E2NH51_9FIRM|nr:antibiotic acetyltransferase [Clostridium indicum]
MKESGYANMRKLAEQLIQKANGRKIVVIGAGTFTSVNMRLLIELGIEISFFVDADYSNRKFFEYQTGFKVMPYCSINRDEHYAFIFQITDSVVSSIISELKEIGYKEQDYSSWTELSNRNLVYKNMTIGKRVSSYDAILGWSSLVNSIGHYSSINRTVQVVADHNIQHLTISSCMSAAPPAMTHSLTIGNDVWIGANVIINASRVKSIGNGAIIGSGAVVLEDVPAYAVVAGVPGKVKKYRFSKPQIDILQRVRWWDWDELTLKANSDCFTDINIFFERFC